MFGINARLINVGELGGPDEQRPGAYSVMLQCAMGSKPITSRVTGDGGSPDNKSMVELPLKRLNHCGKQTTMAERGNTKGDTLCSVNQQT